MSEKHIATLCGGNSGCCPVISLSDTEPPEKQIKITDDFGVTISMSKQQFSSLIQQAKDGKLEV